ncbi:hypothetical protein [Inconstantimicrobium porci]|uniref:Uncharacterized protein n=1 Tax=Inconstantimicrobium porci TaxID=2652291 RepID=A0A7X2MXL8_9CLOT|nr:hypothetical protein [Inconstantimicrobium porci]MSR90971.1 hypothetical protein [Inconstantimicrobium porci]
MINKYIINDRQVFMSSSASEYIKAKYREKAVLTSWYFCDSHYSQKLHAPIYIEIKKELIGVSDYTNLQNDVLKVIKYLRENMKIETKYLRIYFNGENGFYIVLPSIISGLGQANNVNFIIRKIVESIKEETNVDSIRLDIYDISNTHYMFNTINQKTGLYLINLSEELIKQFTYKNLITLAGKNMNETYFEETVIPFTYSDKSVYEIEKDYNGFKQWQGRHIREYGVCDTALKEFKNKCIHNSIYKEQFQKLELSYKDVFLASSKYSMNERKYFVRVMMVEMIKTFISNIHSNDKHVSFRWYAEKPDSERNCALCSDYVKQVDPLIHVNIHSIENEKFCIVLDDFFNNINFDYLLKVIATIDSVIEKSRY